jgi:hypothetical protein
MSGGRRALLSAAGVALVLLAVVGYRAAGTVHYVAPAAAFDYPANWSVHDRFPASTGFGQLRVIVGTQPWGPCGDTDINCHYQEPLAPGTVEVQVSDGSFPGPTLCDRATSPDLDVSAPGDSPRHSTFIRIAGRPAIRTDFEPNRHDYYQADGWREWQIAMAGTTTGVVTVEARDRNPGGSDFDLAIDRLIASMEISEFPDGAGGPADCGAPFPAGS